MLRYDLRSIVLGRMNPLTGNPVTGVNEAILKSLVRDLTHGHPVEFAVVFDWQEEVLIGVVTVTPKPPVLRYRIAWDLSGVIDESEVPLANPPLFESMIMGWSAEAFLGILIGIVIQGVVPPATRQEFNNQA